MILALYAIQWESRNPAWTIRARPEILATLYQLGFERSHPKPEPASNRFGDRVRDVHGRAWLRAHFAPSSG